MEYKFDYTTIEKGIYNPPSFETYPLLKRRFITITPYIESKIGQIIGKDGCHFIKYTEEYNLLYIFFIHGRIEVFGFDDDNILQCIRKIIGKIKYMNHMRRAELMSETNPNNIHSVSTTH